MTGVVVLDEQMWARLEPLVPPVKSRLGQLMVDHRRFVERAIYRCRTAIACRALPAEVGPWQPVGKRHHHLSMDGTWDRMLTPASAQADAG